MRSFGQLESDIMHEVWSHAEPLTAKDVAEALSRTRRVALTTVSTVVERLRDKGLLARNRRGRSYYYEATMTAAEYSAGLMSEVLEEARDRPAALLRFAGQLSDDELSALRLALETHADRSQDPG